MTARFFSLGLILMCILQGCSFKPSEAKDSPTVVITPTLKIVSTSTEAFSTATAIPASTRFVEVIEPTPDPFAFLFDKFEMKSEMVGWGTAWITDQSAGNLNRLLHTSDDGITWLDVTPPYDDSYLSIDDFVFLDGDHAWILNGSHSPDSSSYFPIIWHTFDGGTDWTQSQPVTFQAPPAGGYHISFEDEQHGQLDVMTEVGAGTTWLSSYETSDGGEHWTQKPDTMASVNDQTELLSTLPSRDGIDLSDGCWQYEQSQVSFSEQDSILQVLCGSNLLIYHSHNGGKIWESPFVHGPFLSATLVDFVDANTGWFKGTEDSPSNTKGDGLYVTHDGGETWNEIVPTLNIDNLDPNQIPNDNPVGLIDDIHFIDSETGFAASNYLYDYSLLLKTVDGGETWSSWVPHWQPAK